MMIFKMPNLLITKMKSKNMQISSYFCLLFITPKNILLVNIFVLAFHNHCVVNASFTRFCYFYLNSVKSTFMSSCFYCVDKMFARLHHLKWENLKIPLNRSNNVIFYLFI